MKFYKTENYLKPLFKIKKRTFWQWLTRQEHDLVFWKNIQKTEQIEFDSINDLLSNVVKSTVKGKSALCSTDTGLVFTVDKGRRTLTLQASGYGKDNTEKVLKDLQALFPKIPPNYILILDKVYRINFNVTDSREHSILNSEKNKGG